LCLFRAGAIRVAVTHANGDSFADANADTVTIAVPIPDTHADPIAHRDDD
jgi:hypothetical protein